MSSPNVPRVVFPIPEDLPSQISTMIAQYRQDEYFANLFDVNGSLQLIIPLSAKYVQTFEGTETKHIYGTQQVDGQRGSAISIGIKAYGFELEIKDGREAPYRILRELVNFAYSNVTKPKDIIVHDYVETEGDENGFKARAGKLTGLKRKAGLRRITRDGNVRTLTPGIRFQFMERDRRFLGQ